jgi:diguanylate cyclase (GGDEF)-like protein/PAS domain S-box-containing protein
VLGSLLIPAAIACAAVALLCAMGLTLWLVRRADRMRSFDERRYALLESLPDPFFILDDKWRFTHVNEGAEKLLRRGAIDLIGRRIDQILDPLASELLPDMKRARQSGVPYEFVQTFESTGQAVEIRLQPSSSEMLVYLKDVTERRSSERRLREGERRLRLLLQQVPAVLWTADMRMRITSASGTTLADYAIRESDVLGKAVDAVFAAADSGAEMNAVLKRVFRGESLRYETYRNGRWLQHELEPLRGNDGAIVGVIAAAVDITEMKLSSKRLEQQARIDALTALPNRLALEEQLDAMLAKAKREQYGMAVMFLDLDRFKVINDSLGHRAGDDVLRGVSRRLEKLLSGRARVFRPGGDEFVILTDVPVKSSDVAAIASEILESFESPIVFEGRELSVTGSVGASLYPDNATEAGELIKQADSAMYRAKDAGRQNAKFYSGAMHAHILERMGLELDLRQALTRGELALLYQPIVDLATERIIGAEALLRWNHPLLGEVAPDRFIGIAEEIGCIIDITAWVLVQACAHAAAMRRIGLPNFRIAVNMSVRDLCEPEVHERVSTALAAAGLSPDALDLEVTEGITLNDVAVKALAAIQATGVRVVVDDFGIGYSSLDYIKRLPVGAIKIDKSFVADVVHNQHDQAIVKAITTLAESLGLGVVAEGIETAAQREFLLTVHAPTAQGYYFSRPISQDQFAQLVHALPEVAAQQRAGRVVSIFR